MSNPAVEAYIGLGSNLDNPLKQLVQAVRAMQSLPDSQFQKISDIYRSKPVGPVAQDDFLNAAVKINTRLSPIRLLDALQAIEHRQQRRREVHWGPRTLDLDILSYGTQTIESERLTLPHPEIANRAFVLRPLCDIDPGLKLPGLPLPAAKLLGRLEDQQVLSVIKAGDFLQTCS